MKINEIENDNRKLNIRGFTLVELLVSIGILAVIFAMSSIVLSRVLPSTSQSTTFDTLISDLRTQQSQAMSTDAFYGIYFGSNSYTLFSGAAYNPSSPSNFVVTLDPTVNFTNITLPGNVLVFSPGSGDVNGYLSGSDSVNITNSQTNQVTVVKINQYGATY